MLSLISTPRAARSFSMHFLQVFFGLLGGHQPGQASESLTLPSTPPIYPFHFMKTQYISLPASSYHSCTTHYSSWWCQLYSLTFLCRTLSVPHQGSSSVPIPLLHRTAHLFFSGMDMFLSNPDDFLHILQAAGVLALTALSIPPSLFMMSLGNNTASLPFIPSSSSSISFRLSHLTCAPPHMQGNESQLII